MGWAPEGTASALILFTLAKEPRVSECQMSPATRQERTAVLSIGKLAGGAEGYYLRAVASGVEDYYLGSGEAPGRWVDWAAGQHPRSSPRAVTGKTQLPAAGVFPGKRCSPSVVAGRPGRPPRLPRRDLGAAAPTLPSRRSTNPLDSRQFVRVGP
jgi:hypothetical protein